MGGGPVVHLVRHGESEWNAVGRLQGQTAHVPLTARGLAQSRAAAAALARGRVDAVLTSDLTRARQTAALIAEPHGLLPVATSALREQGLGRLEGVPAAEAAALEADLDWADPDTRPGGGESLRDVYARLCPVLAPLRDAPGVTVLVSHGDTIRVALACLAGEPVERAAAHTIPNAAILTVRPSSRHAFSHGGPRSAGRYLPRQLAWRVSCSAAALMFCSEVRIPARCFLGS